MTDVGHNMTEDLLSSLERKINKVYTQAAEEMQKKIEKQLEKYQQKLAIKQAEYDSGKISKKEFDTWKQNQIHIQNNTKALADTLTQDLVNHNKIATAMINGHTPSVYALNYNFGTYQIESDIKASTSFSLYNHFTVENLIRDNPQILPEWKIDEKKDYIWNYKKVNSALTQGILQGESIPKIAERFRTGLCAQNKNLMTTFARTATTGAQSSGRVDAYKRAKDMGINVKQKWLATLDGRTRHTHRLMDGQTIDMGDKFDNGCRFPGDPTGPAYEVYNCRCTLVPVIKGFERDDSWKNNVVNYEEWEKGGSGFAHWLEEQADPNAAIMTAWSGKKYSFVYNLMKNSDAPGHGADANNFFNALKKLGQDSGIGSPPKVWNAYMTGQLDAEDLKVFENIIKKYLPKDLQVQTGNPFAGKTWSEIIGNEPKLVPGQPAMDYLLDNFDTNWSNHLEDWANGKIKDSKLDEFLLGKKAAKAADNAVDATKIAKKAQDQLDKLKIKAGNPMTKEDADTYKVNPLHNAADKTTTTNCQTTTFAYECRRQGYDIAALPKDDKLDDIFDLQKKLGQDQANGWINKVTGKKPEALIKNDINFNQSKTALINELENVVGKNGERYTLGVRWKSGGAHAVNLDRDEKGIIRIIDNQRGPGEKNTWTIEEYLNEKPVKNIRALYRVDDCVPNAEYFNKIVVDANKMKTTMPVKISDLKPGEYAKVSKAAKAKGETPAMYYKKWKNGIIDDSDLDDIFNAANKVKTVAPAPKPASAPAAKPIAKSMVSADLDVDAFSKKSASAVWKELNANKAGGGKFWKDITDIGKKNGMKPAEAWKKYLAGELDADDVKKIKTHLAKIYKKADDIKDAAKTAAKTAGGTDDLIKIKKDLPNSSVTDAINLMDDKHAEYVWDQIEFKSKDLGITMDEYWKKYLDGNMSDLNLDTYLKNATIDLPAATTKATAKAAAETIDMDLLKTKKVSKVWNELKDQGGTAYSQFWKTVGEVGKDYGLEKKQSKVWDLYINGKLKPEESKKIDDFLLKHYFKKADDVVKTAATKSDDIIKLEKQIDKIDNAINDLEKNPNQYKFTFHGKIQNFDDITWNITGTAEEKLQKIISMGAKPTNASQKLVDLLDEKQNLKGQILSLQNKAKSAATKSDDLIKAEAKLKKAEEELKKLSNPTYSGIWKDDVTLADYEAKKGTINAKKIWYKDKIDELEKLKTDTNSYEYTHWGVDGIDKKIKEFEKNLNDLDDFEVAGKEYAKYQKAVEKAKKEVQDLTPVGETYTQARKDAAVWIKNDSDYRKIDPYYDKVARDIKPTRTTRENEGMKHYTWGSMPFNSPLAGFKGDRYTNFVGVNKVDINVGGYGERIRGLTSLVEKSHYDKDVWVATAQDEITIESFLGVKPGTLHNMTQADAQQFVGVQNEIPQFISAAVQKGGGSYVPGNMTINIYCPEGSEILYVLEDGHFGKSEKEMILQRGGTYKLTRIYKDTGAHGRNEWIVDLELHPEYGYDKFQQK